MRLRVALPRYATLPPEAQRRLVLAVLGAMEEFTRIVEAQPPTTPPADALLIEIARQADHPERFLLALHTTLETVRGAVAECWPDLPRSRPHSARIDAALARYAELLCTRTMSALHPAGERWPGPGRSEEIRLARLFAVAERRWAGEPMQLCLRPHPSPDRHPTSQSPGSGRPGSARPGSARPGSARPAGQDPAGHGPGVGTRRPRSAHPDRDGAPRALHLTAADHVLVVGRHCPARATGAPRPARAAIALAVGPVSADELAPAYDTGLLQLRLIRAGVAAAPPDPVALPDLGFLHPRPNQATVAKIATLLAPLTAQSAHRRVALARTMQVFLRTAGTAQSLAGQLGMHAQTVRNHLGAVRELYDSHDLDFGRDTLTIQAALAIVLPLWEVEARHPG